MAVNVYIVILQIFYGKALHLCHRVSKLVNIVVKYTHESSRSFSKSADAQQQSWFSMAQGVNSLYICNVCHHANNTLATWQSLCLVQAQHL